METPRCRYSPVLTWQLASVMLMLVCAIPSFGHTVVFGPKTFTTEQASIERFDLTSPCDRQANAVYTLVITNGDAAGNRRASSARVVLNGSEIAGPNDFSQQAGSIERTVVPAASNTLDVTINGPKDATLSISLRRHIDLCSPDDSVQQVTSIVFHAVHIVVKIGTSPDKRSAAVGSFIDPRDRPRGAIGCI